MKTINKYLQKFFLVIGVTTVILLFSCHDNLTNSVDKTLLNLHVFDTAANITFPNLLSLDTNYTWVDFSDCHCCGKLKVRYQNKKDSIYKESGLFSTRWHSKYRTYLTFIFPEDTSCNSKFEVNDFAWLSRKFRNNIIDQDFHFPGSNKNMFIESTYINSKNQPVYVYGNFIYFYRLHDIYVSINVLTYNRRNSYPIKIKFEKSTKGSIKDFIRKSLETIDQLEIK